MRPQVCVDGMTERFVIKGQTHSVPESVRCKTAVVQRNGTCVVKEIQPGLLTHSVNPEKDNKPSCCLIWMKKTELMNFDCEMMSGPDCTCIQG